MLKTLATAGSKEARQRKQDGTTRSLLRNLGVPFGNEPCLLSTAQSAGERMCTLHSLRIDRHIYADILSVLIP